MSTFIIDLASAALVGALFALAISTASSMECSLRFDIEVWALALSESSREMGDVTVSSGTLYPDGQSGRMYIEWVASDSQGTEEFHLVNLRKVGPNGS